jgi:hypothetical protein
MKIIAQGVKNLRLKEVPQGSVVVASFECRTLRHNIIGANSKDGIRMVRSLLREYRPIRSSIDPLKLTISVEPKSKFKVF